MTRIVRTVATFALLLAGFFGYERGFAILASRVAPPTPVRAGTFDLRPSDSIGAQKATELARRVLGEHHWTSGAVSDVTKYYNNERGYWMYWSSFEFPDEHDRKRIILAPFAVIWGSNKDGSVKVMSGDRAIIDFDQPFSFLAPGPKPSVVHAKIEGIDEHVLILDDKATPDPADDLVVTLPYAEYFEKQMQIRCEEQVQLIEGGYTVSGRGLVIALRPPEASGGFPGAEVVTLNERVEITAEDVGRSGLLPGNALPDQQVVAAEGGEGPADQVKTPGRLTCDGPMRLQLPRPRLPARVGPPAPGQPTIAEFSRNVVIERGAERPDRITGDHLYAVLVPRDLRPPASPVETTEAEAASATATATASGAEAGSGDGLRLLEARVDGHVVWLESLAERVRCRGNELIYRKPEEDTPEVSYFRADPGQQIQFERAEPNGQIVTILSADATLHGDPERKGRSTVIARGPGLLEMRAGRDAPVDRSATWRDEMVVETNLTPSQPDDQGSRTFITLQGWPILHDPKQLTLAAREKVVVSLMPRPASAAAVASPLEPDAEDGGTSYRIEWVSALGDVHLVTPDNANAPAVAEGGEAGRSESRRELNAREKLDVVFTYLDDSPATPAPSGVIAQGPGQPGARTVMAAQSGTAGIQAAGERSEPSPSGPASGTAGDAQASVGTEAKAPEPGRPFSAEADLVWARIEVVGDASGLDLAGSNGGTREVREARLRKNVVIHQDPAPGKEVGFHVDADSGVDVENIGPGRLRIYAHGESRPVTVASDDLYIQGFPEASADRRVVLGVDQAYDFAFVQGPGRLWNLTNKAAMGRIDQVSTKRDEAPDENREPLIVTWADRMTFYGQFALPDGRPGPARALFLGDVKSRHGDSGVVCREMEAIFDRPISFDRAIPGGGGDSARSQPEDEDRIEIDSVICNGRVSLWSLVREKENPAAFRELREAEGESVTFDRPADRFWIDGAGTVSVATLDNSENGDSARVLPTADRGRRPASRLPLTKLRVDFNDGLEGQLGTANGGYRVAEFRGDARAIRARVAQFREELDYDRPPSDAVLLDGETIYVVHNPAVPGIPERTFLKAFGSAQGRSDGKTLLGDTITYDSNTGRFFVQGTPAAPVTIFSQETVGQPGTRTSARALWYNTKTEESEVIEPGSAIFVRPQTAGRLGRVSPREEKPEKEKERPEPRLPSRGDMERQGFTGN
ncbi:hypothetical protein [Tautonia sociabilis]|uniref:Uncharacterized protein n=1 Tax=Tautonia sociabilis TaxID=2080755 RepID=A0A432MFF7_9BACT|nr:hypothetical protein [Tautonia sociabilis]RUL84912.1 hypothetical protein TsocGM_19770 [Tautonia sociabilis]